MPPRHAYWTILVDDQPTAFRAHDPEELLATLNRLKEKHPSATMKWFERGRLWESRDAARQEGLGQGERRWEGKRPEKDDGGGPPRDRNWRPGGEHRDPRQKYKDAKKAKWQRFKQNIRDRQTPGRGGASAPPAADRQSFSPPRSGGGRTEDLRPRSAGWKPKGPPRGESPRREDRSDRPRRDDDRGGWQAREKPSGNWRDRPPRDQDRRDAGKQPFRPKVGGARRGPKRFADRKPWGPKPAGAKGGSRKPWSSKPGTGRPKPGGRAFGPRGPKKPRDEDK